MSRMLLTSNPLHDSIAAKQSKQYYIRTIFTYFSPCSIVQKLIDRQNGKYQSR